LTVTIGWKVILVLNSINNQSTIHEQAEVKVSGKDGVEFMVDINEKYIFPRTRGTAGQVLTTPGAVSNNSAQLSWTDIGDLVSDVTADNGLTKTGDNVQLGGDLIIPTTITTDATNTLAVAGLQTAETDHQLVVAEADGTLRQIKAALPKFFYMPPVIFDTSVTGTFTRDLHAEYVAQFGTPMVSSEANPSIPTLPATELEYHITYYDIDVFANLSIDANGVLNYDIIGNATEASFMTIVFVVKD
jgi:hypothetical protein